MASLVKITKSGDSNLVVGRTLLLDTFLSIVKRVLLNGGEMPVAVLEPSTEV